MLKNKFSNTEFEAGTDEAGRGCLAGPVVAAAVILPSDFHHPAINDSKKLTEKLREDLRHYIEENALDYGVSFIPNEEVDEINVLKASIAGMHRSLDQLSLRPTFIIVDGNRFYPYQNVNYKTIVKGDAKYTSIAAASILAKTYRDEFMKKIHEEYPYYGWDRNKGYPTRGHREAILKNGISPYHRRSFKLLPDQLSFDF